ncbi:MULTISPECIES: hypothetical protein [Rhodococcus]|jgi:hypothetical protein|uniref:DUF3618 domain-containing protein n=1 Tax=Rhodococcus oxybenzonivorans TaxID=1990687 RepID=A0AAE5AAJ2_9NOCA|nr:MULTISPECIES: hypothetical protein [Rhodococcus]MDV7242357.1 hypothetical protein [Rhodococcus oxybenzonivorans]MDV7268854.1 hypothetical protein [Rhodococcus oxybenzonivorans]MDV7277104.1 hypothetical protein [Rhodococcus oxybenzonivorans]MDV7331846.1 hypothetical protein [Rhodococcus oxybenzonivorans]MDV7344067.1 hypothetical protein [Rhodococcus oxybenzonivorans]
MTEAQQPNGEVTTPSPPVEQQRADLAATVDALHKKIDIGSRAKAHARHDIETLKQQPQRAAAVGVVASLLLVLLVVRRRRRNAH